MKKKPIDLSTKEGILSFLADGIADLRREKLTPDGAIAMAKIASVALRLQRLQRTPTVSKLGKRIEALRATIEKDLQEKVPP